MNQEILDKTLVVTFSQDERTVDLCNYCYEKLGFKNIKLLNSPGGFHDKYIEFSDIVAATDYEYYLRNDADRLVFDGIYKLFDMMEADKDLVWVTGDYFDYIMNRFRGGTPTVHRRPPLLHLNKNKGMMKDVQKPEATYATSIMSMYKMKTVKIFTNLHEFEQYPSKVCNAFLNRLGRNHYPNLYDNNYLNSLPAYYKNAIQTAFDYYQKNGNKNSMVFEDFSYLDKDFKKIDYDNLDNIYENYLNLYKELEKKYK